MYNLSFFLVVTGGGRRVKVQHSNFSFFHNFVTFLSTVFLECNLESRTRYVWYHALEKRFFFLLCYVSFMLSKTLSTRQISLYSIIKIQL